jgi:hypothetical protein
LADRAVESAGDIIKSSPDISEQKKDDALASCIFNPTDRVAKHFKMSWISERMLKTPLCDLLGINVPIILVPMGTRTSGEFAAVGSYRQITPMHGKTEQANSVNVT